MSAANWFEVLKAVRACPMTREEIVFESGASLSTVKRWVREGVAQGVLIEVQDARDAFDTRAGRHVRRVTVAPAWRGVADAKR